MKYHNIDNELIKNFLIHVDQSDEKIKSHLIDWHLALNKGDEEDCIEKAKNLIKTFVDGSITFLGINPNASEQELFSIYGSLENILRIAVFLRDGERIRDHLNHTIRNILFSIYIMNNVWKINDIHLRNKLIIACAFHDIAYPIEKLKKVAKKIIDSTLEKLINSNGKIDINISNTSKLLELIDFIGNNFERENITKDQITNINVLYCKTIIPAIADKGIFETKHCLSSTVIFLRYLYDYSDIGRSILRDNFEDILDICFAISYHDRERDIFELSQFPEMAKILRVTDELQEWDRDSLDYSYCFDASLNTPKDYLIEFDMKDKLKDPNKECSPYLSIRDKIRGLANCVNNIRVRFKFPDNRVNIEEIKDKLRKYFSKEGNDKRKIKLKFSSYNKGEKCNVIDLEINDNNILLSYSK